MAYNPPSIGPAGLSVPSEPDIQAKLIQEFLAIYGQSNYLAPDTADYQDISVRALQYADANGALQQVYVSLNPLCATGQSLDNCGMLIGVTRMSATASRAILELTGTPGAVITNGLAQDPSGNYWALPPSVTIGSGGTLQTEATCQTLGVVTAEANTITAIATPQAGWTSVNNADAVAVGAGAGQTVEPDSSYRARLLISQAQPSRTMIGGTQAALLALPGVGRVMVYENPTNQTDINGVPAHSIVCIVEGGDPVAVCQAIYNNKGIGCGTYGSVTRSITDPTPGGNGGLAQNISYFPLTYTSVYAQYLIHPLNGFTTATPGQIVADVVAYLNQLSIGESVYASELVGAALNARPDPDNPSFVIRGITYGVFVLSTTASLAPATPFIEIAAPDPRVIIGQTVTGPGLLPATLVTSVSGVNVGISKNPIGAGPGQPVNFYTLTQPNQDIAIPWNTAALGSATNIFVTLV